MAQPRTALAATPALLTGPPTAAGAADTAVSWARGRTPAAVPVTRAASRRAALGLLVLAATLPLQWESVLNNGLGSLRYFHLGAVAMVLIARPSAASVRAVVRQVRPVLPAMVVVTVVGVVVSAGWHSGPVDWLQTFVYLLGGLVAGGCCLVALQHASGRTLLRWASPVSILAFAVAFGQALQSLRISPVSTVTAAIAQGNPQLLEFGLYRAAFATTDAEARTNLRHEIFASFIVTLGLTLLAGAVTRLEQVVVFSSGLVTVGFVLMSQSRSVSLALGIGALLGLSRAVLRARIPYWVIGVVLLLITSLPVLVPKLGPLLVARFSESGSYDARLGALNLPASQVLPRLAHGGPPLDVSTHMLIGDATLRGGILCGLAALLVLIGFASAALRSYGAYLRVGSLPTFSATMLMALVITRAFTTGSGQLHLVEWVGLGATGAVLHLLALGSPAVLDPTAGRDGAHEGRRRPRPRALDPDVVRALPHRAPAAAADASEIPGRHLS